MTMDSSRSPDRVHLRTASWRARVQEVPVSHAATGRLPMTSATTRRHRLDHITEAPVAGTGKFAANDRNRAHSKPHVSCRAGPASAERDHVPDASGTDGRNS